MVHYLIWMNYLSKCTNLVSPIYVINFYCWFSQKVCVFRRLYQMNVHSLYHGAVRQWNTMYNIPRNSSYKESIINKLIECTVIKNKGNFKLRNSKLYALQNVPFLWMIEIWSYQIQYLNCCKTTRMIKKT